MPPEEEARIDNLMAERWDMPELKKDMSKFNRYKKENVSFNSDDMQAFIFPASFDSD